MISGIKDNNKQYMTYNSRISVMDKRQFIQQIKKN